MRTEFPQTFYDRFASRYGEYSASRERYLKAVENILVSSVNGGRLLDVGSGDGVRIARVAQRVKPNLLVATEPSGEMFKLAQATLPTASHFQLAAENLDEITNLGPFDTITCLWNVLGHIDDRARRIKALRNMGNLLTGNGSIWLDVQNKHNIREYGARKVASNILRGRSSGDVSYTVQVGGESIPGKGHVFSPQEVNGLATEAGLAVKERHVIDYRTGDFRKTVFGGQLLYRLGKKNK